MDRFFGSYILNERIGVGGMGEVYRTTKRGPEGFEVQVALKLILPHLAEEEHFRRMFSREARLAALLKHPNIVQVNGFDILDGRPFIEMEYIDGANLASLLNVLHPGQTLTLDESAHVIHGVSRGLAYAHSFNRGTDESVGVIHRDLNPHNILVSTEGEVKIADFGIARAAMADTTDSATLMGRLAYMSPEQVDGRPIDHRSDLFSLGTTAYQLLTGDHPFRRTSEAGTLKALQEATFMPLSKAAPALPPPMITAVESLLTVSPDDRPDSALAVAGAFEEHLKPAAAKMLGKRVRGPMEKRRIAPTDPVTAPTQVRSSSSLNLWFPVLLILAMVVLFLFNKTGVREEQATEPVPAPAPFVQDHQQKKPEGPEVGKVRVQTLPSGARIHSGDTVVGLSPLTVAIPRDETSVELMFTLEGYEPAVISATRDHAPDSLNVILTPLPKGTLRISAIPWARIQFMGRTRGMTPVMIEDVPVGTHEIILTNDELGVSRKVDLEVREGINPPYVFDLINEKPARVR
jgi:serine/threonine-protein kinase